MNKKHFHRSVILLFIASLLVGPVSLFGQSAVPVSTDGRLPAVELRSVHTALLRDARGSETSQLLRPLFGADTDAAVAVINEDDTDLLLEVNSAVLAES
jgi:hypothetical protein